MKLQNILKKIQMKIAGVCHSSHERMKYSVVHFIGWIVNWKEKKKRKRTLKYKLKQYYNFKTQILSHKLRFNGLQEQLLNQ